VSDNEEVIKRLLDLEKSSEVLSSVSYQKLSLNANDALCEVAFDTKFYTLDELNAILKDERAKIVTSMRCSDLDYETPSAYFETNASYVLNEAITNKEDVVYVECYSDKYKILKIKNL